MNQKFFSVLRVFLSLSLVLSLGACSGGLSAGLEPFQSPDGRYGFLFPTGWIRVEVSGGPAVVFHDLINSEETLSLVVSPLNSDVDLQSLGSPEEIGQKLFDQLINSNDSGPDIELIETNQRENSGHIFYDLEYKLNSSERSRHELATISVDRGYLYTFAASTNEKRWPNIRSLFERVITSFTFLI